MTAKELLVELNKYYDKEYNVFFAMVDDDEFLLTNIKAYLEEKAKEE